MEIIARLANLPGALPGACAQGLIWGIMAIGVYLTYRILDVADLTVDGSFGTGGAVCVMCLLSGQNVWVSLLMALLAGLLSGLVTGVLHTFMGIPAILAGILTQLSLYSINLKIMGKANQAINVDKYNLLISLRWVKEFALHNPIIMGILVSVIVGVALTLPISSAAICAALGLTGLAGGAAVAGCCAQMVGFAVMSYKENGVGGLVSQGLGTSMLQMPNILRNPRTWIPPTLAAAITGPIATCLFHLEMNGPAVSSGMGTCGLVGQIGVYTGWIESGKAVTAFDWIGLVLICFVLPAVLSTIFCDLLRKKGWIKEGDLKL